jgi:hypothetical protein
VTVKVFDDSSSWIAATNTVLDMQTLISSCRTCPVYVEYLRLRDQLSKVAYNVHKNYTFRTNSHTPTGNS